MRHTRTACLLLIVPLCLIMWPVPPTGGPVYAQAGREAGNGASPRIRDLPWHLTSIRWYSDEYKLIEHLSIDVVFLDEFPADSEVFIVPFNGQLNQVQFYTGCATRLPAVEWQGQYRVLTDRGLIFSRWGTTDKAYCRPSHPSWQFAYDNEGEYVGSRPPYKWGPAG